MFFYDARTCSWRLKKDFIVFENKDPLCFGKHTRFARQVLSITVSKYDGDAPLAWFRMLKNVATNIADACFVGGERGAKKGAAAMRTAEATRTERAEDELEFGRQAAVSMSTTHALALVDSEECMSFETWRTGSLSNPRPTVHELSPAVRAALTRKRARNAAAAEIGAMPSPVAPVHGEVDVLGSAVDPNWES